MPQLPKPTEATKKAITTAVAEQLKDHLAQGGALDDKALITALRGIVGVCVERLPYAVEECKDPKVIATTLGITVDKILALEGRPNTSIANPVMTPADRNAMLSRLTELGKKKNDAEAVK